MRGEGEEGGGYGVEGLEEGLGGTAVLGRRRGEGNGNVELSGKGEGEKEGETEGEDERVGDEDAFFY